MRFSCAAPDKRTWIFFFLIILVALLWASFLLIRGEMVSLSVTLAVVAALISLFAFICCARFRSWIFLYLIVLVALLWSSFLVMQGSMIWVSALLVIVAIGMSLFSFLFCETEQ